ncbi:MAG: DUF664 domain-containing protein [Pseudonocardiaceae bacterium]
MPAPDPSVVIQAAVADERPTLEAFLDYYRATVAAKVSGMTEAQARSRLVPSATTLAGIVRHLRLVDPAMSSPTPPRTPSPSGTRPPEKWAGPQLVETFRDHDPRSRTAHVSWAGHRASLAQPGSRGVGVWIHRQQIHQALGRPTDLRSELTGPILGGLRWAYPFRLGHVHGAPGDTVSITISGAVSVTWHVVAS